MRPVIETWKNGNRSRRCSGRARGAASAAALGLIIMAGMGEAAPAIAACGRYVATGGADTSECIHPSAPCGTIAHAVTSAAPGDTIHIAAGVYTEHDILIAKNLFVTGEGEGATILQAAVDPLLAQGRVLSIAAGSSVVLEDLTVRRGRAAGGGGISNAGTLTLERCVVEQCRALQGAMGGGGILNEGTLTLDRCTVRNNISETSGGGISSSGALTIVGATIEGNSATLDGGGLFAAGNTVLDDSTVSGNGAARGAGVFAAAVLIANNSTIGGNTAGDTGGGLASAAASALNSCTVSLNSAGGAGGGGGVAGTGAGSVAFKNTILGGNTAAGSPTMADCGGSALSQGYNLVGAGAGCQPIASGDRTVAPSQFLGGVLEPLASNGGRTRAHALVPGSPARDAGHVAGCFVDLDGSPTTPETVSAADQRSFERPQDGNGDGTVRCDIGAFESGPGFRPVSDGFFAPVLNTSLWTFGNPVGDASVSVDGTRARIVIPAGPTHDVWVGGNNSARILQPAPNGDFEIEVKFESSVTVGNQIQGVLVEQDAGKFIRFDTFNADGSQTRIFAATFVSGTPTVRVNSNIPPSGGAPFWMRIKRQGNLWTQMRSYDGVSFTTSATFSFDMTVNRVGPFAGNWRATLPAPAFTAVVDYFRNTAQPVFSDDGQDAAAPVLSAISVTPTGATSATISWTTDEPSTSAVEIGATAADTEATTTVQNLVTSHTVGVSGLACGPVHYKVVSTDASGNTARSADATVTVAPCFDPDPPVIAGMQAAPFEDEATITWTTDEPATSRVEYGLTTDYGTATPLDPTLLSCHSALLTGLECGQTYHFRALSTDAAGNPATSPDAVFDSPDCPDTTPPVITDVVASPTGTEATVTWRTDEPATSRVEYGLTTDYGQATPFDGTLVTSHLVGVTGLDCGTTYHYRVVSADASDNSGSSPDDEFMTDACDTAPPVITDVGVEPTDTTGTVKWTTDEPATSRVEYGLTTDYGQATPLDSTLVATHSVGVTGLDCATTYHYRVISADASDNSGSSPDATFMTGACDTTPPVITDVAAAPAATAATVTWTTDEPATSRVEYGPTTDYGQATPLDSTLVTSHSVGVTGLDCATTYHYRVVSADASDNSGSSPDATFMTGACDTTPPVITDVAAAPAATAATVTWTTDEPATSRVEYGPTTDYGQATPLDSTLVTSHSVGLMGLVCGTTHHYRVVSADASDNSGSSPDATFATSACTPGSPISDDFHAGALNTSLWSAVNPLGFASIGLNGTNLLFGLPADLAHDAWIGGNTTPRIMQTISDVSFEVEAKFESAVQQPFQSQGILVEQGLDDYLRFDVFHDGSVPRIFAASIVAGAPTIRVNASVPSGGPPFWVRVTRSGDQWTESWSTDGASFTTAGTFTHVLTVSKTGPFAGNAGSPPPAFTSSVDYFFNTASPIDPEDGVTDTLPPTITDVAATPSQTGATVTWTTDEPATSRVEYGTTTAYGSATPVDPALVTSHSVGVVGLLCNTPYHYRVVSVDASSNSASSPDMSFTTSACPLGGPISDDFHAGALNTSLWSAVNPLGDASIGLNGTNLLFELQAGSGHDAWIGGNTTPRIMQMISDVSFEVVVKFESAVLQPFQTQGILVEQGPDDYLRFDVFHDGNVPRIFAASLVAGAPNIRVNTPLANAGPPFWLRVTRSGDQWTESWSTDGAGFTTAVTFTHVLTVSRTGPFAGNGGAPPPAFISSVDYFFNTASPIDPEDEEITVEPPRPRTGAVRP